MQATGTRIAVVVIALTMLVALVAVSGRETIRGASEKPAPARPAPAPLATPGFPVPGALPPDVFVIGAEEEPGPPARLAWAIAAIVVIGIVTAAFVLARELRLGGWHWRRRRPRRRAAHRSSAAELAGSDAENEREVARRAVEAALEPLRDPADARAAVIAAYARMEEVLAERTLGRRTPEAPREYLVRILREGGMPERSLTTLTALFEEARFSRHPVSSSASGHALNALENARDALAARDAAVTGR
jgi:hypothetical protein